MFSLEDFIRLIPCADGMLACSTGPLHVAAACGIRVLGLYPGARPKHPGRWGPVGIKTEVITDDHPLDAPLDIPVDAVRGRLLDWIQRDEVTKIKDQAKG
jgi:ADP-heptose:LPS heptosyltransferase